MGWSCTARAGIASDAIHAALCTGEVSNEFERNGSKYFIELNRREHDDGHITGSIWRFLPDGEHTRRSASLCIEADGVIIRPAYMRKAALETGFSELSKQYPSDSPLYPEYCASYTANGVREGLIWTLGQVHPDEA